MIMILLILGLLSFEQPEDFAVYYGMDMQWSTFSRYWDDCYDTSLSAFRTAQGSHDMFYWYQRFEGKVEVPFARIMSIRYTIQGKNDLDTSRSRHRLDLGLRFAPNLRAHLVISPFYSKRYDELGTGLSWRKDNANWLYLYAIMQGFNHNNSMRHVRPGPERDPYSTLPFRFELDSRGELDWLRARLHGELGTHSAQYLDWPDSTWYTWKRDHDRSCVWGRVEVKPLDGLWVGSRFSWLRDRALTRWPEQDSLIADTLSESWVEPYVSWSPTERLELLLEHRFWRTYRGMDSLTYRRDYNLFMGLISWQPARWLLLQAGFQNQWRYRYNDEELIAEPWSGIHERARLVFNVEFRFSSGFMFVIHEGIKLTYFPQETFRRPHNHTYVEIYMPLNAPFRPHPKDCRHKRDLTCYPSTIQ